MPAFDEEPARPKTAAYRIGQDVSLLSVDELARRIGELKTEIVRLEREIAARDVTRSAAESLFRKT